MAGILAKIISWIASKAVLYLVILGVLLFIFVVTVVPPMVANHYEKQLETAIADLNESQAMIGSLAQQVNEIGGKIDEKANRIRELEEKRREMDKWLTKVKNLFRRAEIKRERERLAKEQEQIRGEMRSLAGQRQELRAADAEGNEELKRRELLREDKERQLTEIRKIRHAIGSLMRNEILSLAIKALLILGAVIVLPFLWKLVAYYILAPIAQRTRPILLEQTQSDVTDLTVTPSHPAQRIDLIKGEVLLTNSDYLQSSMGEFAKNTKWLLDWRFPLSSLASGLYVLTQFRSVCEHGEVTLSSQQNATRELAVVHVPVGRVVVFRPRFLVAVVHQDGLPPTIRSRWIFWKLHSWVNLQFRYLLIEGDAKLVFAAQRGIQAEKVRPEMPGRRVNSNLTVSFSPHLKFSPMRSETFVAYLRGASPLFDDFFSGEGWAIHQQVNDGRTSGVKRVWEGLLNAIGKVFGL